MPGRWSVSFESSDRLRDRRRSSTCGEDESGDPCACGIKCAERDYKGNARRGPRAFCRTDTGYIARAIAELPSDYVQLWLRLPRSEQPGEHITGSKEPPLPLDVNIEAFLREIVHVLCSWEEAVQRVARLTPHEGDRRQGVMAAAASRTLGAHLDTLLSLQAETVVRYISPHRLAQIGEDALLDDPDLVWWDTSGDAWIRQPMDGVAAGMELLHLHSRARSTLGLNRGRVRIPEVPCDGEGCGMKTLYQPEALAGGLEPVVRCSNCPNVYAGPRFDLLMGRVYQAQVDALNQHERDRRSAAAA